MGLFARFSLFRDKEKQAATGRRKNKLCTDNLTGFDTAIHAVFPETEIQNCMIHQLRKVTKSKSVFPTDDSLLKMLYLAMMDITKKWTGRRQDWSRIHAQLSIYFAERMPD